MYKITIAMPTSVSTMRSPKSPPPIGLFETNAFARGACLDGQSHGRLRLAAHGYHPTVRLRTLLSGLAVTAVAAGCAGGGSGSHSALTAAQALHRARTDGFTRAGHGPRESLECSARTSKVGPPQPTGRYADYKRPMYTIEFGDRRAPPTRDNTGRIAMAVFVFADTGFAARCAHAGIYTSEHQPIHPDAVAVGRRSKTFPYKLIGETTIETHMHKRDARGAVFPSDGQYETYLANGGVYATGLAYTEHDSRIVQQDLARIAAEING